MTGDPEATADDFAAQDGEQFPAEAAVEGTCLPLPPLDLDALNGVLVLGVLPAFLPADPVAWYADGVVPAPRFLPDDLPALRPRFLRPPTVGGAGAPLQPVVDALVDEAGAAWDRDRLASRLFALASLLREGEGGDAEAAEALRCAVADDPEHVLARFALEAVLSRDAGAAVERVNLLDRPGAPAADAHRAGHVARTQVGDGGWALDIWWTAAERHPNALEPLLASYLVHLESGDAQAAAALAEMLYQAALGPRFWGVLSADRIARARGYWAPEQLRADVLATLERRGATPAVLAVGEDLAFSTQDHALLKRLLEARIVEVEHGGDRAELAVLWARMGWLHEEMGQEEAAQEACERALSAGGAPGYARRRALALARRQGSHTLIHRLQSARSEDASLPAGERAMALVERAAADLALDRAADGRMALARAVELDRSCRPALAALGRAALDLGDVPGQIQLFAAELAALEAQASPGAASRIADRAVRLAVLRQRTGREVASALDACRRALAAVPGDRDAFLVGADILARLGQWAALAALYARRAGQGVEPAEAVEYLALAADLFRTKLNDPAAAGRLLAQALRLAPQHPYVLRRAAEVFAQTGQRRAWAEVEGRLGLQGAAHAVRSGRLLEFGDAGEEQAARAAFQAGGHTPAALDGQVRASARFADAEPLASVPSEALQNTPLLRLTVAEALLAGGRPVEALALLPEESNPADGSILSRAFMDLRGTAAALAGDWSALAAVLVAQGAASQGKHRADLWTRAAEVRALRAGDVAGALELFQRALAVDPEHAGAKAGLARWQTPEATRDAGPLATAAAARRAGDWVRHDAVLRQAAEHEVRPDEAAGLRRAAGLGAEQAPAHRADLFVTAFARSTDGRERVALLSRRVEQARLPEQPELLRRLIHACLAAGDLEGCRAAAQRLLALEPNSIPAGLALGRVAALTGQASVAHPGLTALASAVRAPTHRERVGAALAAAEADPLSRARGLLQRGRAGEARALVGILPPSLGVDVLQAEISEALGESEAAISARMRAFEGLTGPAQADQAFRIAELLFSLERTVEAAHWFRRAVTLDPEGVLTRGERAETDHRRRFAERLQAAGQPVGDAFERICAAIEARLAAGLLAPDDLAELARLHRRRAQPIAAELARQAAEYAGADLEPASILSLQSRPLQPTDWDRLRDSQEKTPTADLLALLADPLAAALAGPPVPMVAGAERWQAEVGALFVRLGLPRPPIALAADARWGGRLTPGPLLLAPAREAPLDEPASFLLGSLAAGFQRGRLLVLNHDPALVAGGLAVLRRGVTGDKSLITLEDPVPLDRRARLLAAASALDHAERDALAQADEGHFAVAAVAALAEAFRSTGRRAGLLACGDLAVALDVVLGRGGGSPRARRQALAASPPALALLAWALGADHRALLAAKGGAA